MSKQITLATLAMLFSAFGAQADAVYTYTGNSYIDFTTPFGEGDYLHGSFVLSTPLAANLVNYTFTPLSFSFSGFAGGYPTIDETNETVENFEIWTDSQGTIKFWEVDLAAGPYSLDTVYGPVDTGHDLAVLGSADGLTSYRGTWTSNVTPEPATSALFAVGLLASCWLVRRSKLQRSRRSALAS